MDIVFVDPAMPQSGPHQHVQAEEVMVEDRGGIRCVKSSNGWVLNTVTCAQHVQLRHVLYRVSTLFVEGFSNRPTRL